jgi:N-acetyl-1-D-myo-inositol-2-amino-2-deoxy-alpha-D-glucopyranoside deacetylase
MLARTSAYVCGLAAALMLAPQRHALAQAATRTLMAVLAHADDETPVGPILARYAREGAHVHVVIATDGAQGGANTSIPRGPELARVRAEEARCAANALGAQPPILLEFPDGKLGDFTSDPTLLFRLTARVAAELQRLRPDAIITWGPDGGVGHPDHRLVSDVVTQLVRAGAPGAPQRVFHMYIPAEGIRAMNPQRGAPSFLIPEEKYFTVRVPFTPPDLDAAQRAMACHRTQFAPEVVERIFPVQARVWNGSIALVPALATAGATDLFR